MPAAWRWYACLAAESNECAYESPSRAEALAAIALDFPEGTQIEVLEARMSTDKRYEGHDFVPFTAVRNQETLTLGSQGSEVHHG